jgi:hypothetical protein
LLRKAGGNSGQPKQSRTQALGVGRRHILRQRGYLSGRAEGIGRHGHRRYGIQDAPFNCNQLKLDLLDFVDPVEKECDRVTFIGIAEFAKKLVLVRFASACVRRNSPKDGVRCE